MLIKAVSKQHFARALANIRAQDKVKPLTREDIRAHMELYLNSGKQITKVARGAAANLKD